LPRLRSETSLGDTSIRCSPRRGWYLGRFATRDDSAVNAVVELLADPPIVRQSLHSDSSKTILVIEDESQICRLVSNALTRSGHYVLEATTGRRGIDIVAAEQPALIILDLGLPDVPGIEVCRAIRAISHAPIIVLSAHHSEDEKVALLTAGADDYITKPFGLRELVARVLVQLRRIEERFLETGSAPLEVDGLRIDFAGHRVTRDGTDMHLTRVEWKLLATLVARAGRTLTHRQIIEAVWGRQFGNTQQSLRVHITHLRRKLERDPSLPSFIVTEPGVGYRFQLPASAFRAS
jgi:two-component system KDP operon response regulator KdpE